MAAASVSPRPHHAIPPRDQGDPAEARKGAVVVIIVVVTGEGGAPNIENLTAFL